MRRKEVILGNNSGLMISEIEDVTNYDETYCEICPYFPICFGDDREECMDEPKQQFPITIEEVCAAIHDMSEKDFTKTLAVSLVIAREKYGESMRDRADALASIVRTIESIPLP